MKEVLDELFAAYQAGDTTAMATVVRTWRSAPRPAGASMLVNVAGEATGSVSGGCVEGAVYELAGEVIANGVPQFEKYGISNDDAFAVGLTCGGILEVFVEQVSKETWPELPDLFASVQADQPVAVATVVNGTAHVGKHLVVWPDRIAGDLGSSRLNSAVGADVLGLLESGTTGFLHYGSDGERLEGDLEIFVSTFAPKPRMLVFGAIDFAAAVAKAGKFLGFYVTVCDAREVFATKKRFPDADEVVNDWPHRWLAKQEIDSRTVICILTHDPKFDVPVVIEALKTKAAYIGAMGSRKTHGDRVTRLIEAGVSQADLQRIKSPIGLDLGARTPEETAISIVAEIIQDRWGGSGKNLAQTEGTIHPGAPR
ncbi:MAG: dehydrogenase maturation factor, XdhC/CoxF family [Actinomycetota bacterium]